MYMQKAFFIILSSLLAYCELAAQETLTFPTYVPEIAKAHQAQRKAQLTNDTCIRLPFYDDFSRAGVFPDHAFWNDDYAFVNRDFGKFPPTVGVATLDAIDNEGKLYSGASTFPFDADQLTSRPIRLDSVFNLGAARPIRRSDSLYFSFYYQPQGRGSMPSRNDSLILEFHSPGETDTATHLPVWRHIWASAGGVSVDSFALLPYRYFRQVLIPVLDSSLYFKNGFQFRFRNIASLANNYLPDWKSNCDHWNIDVVRLDTRRSIYDTAVQDVAFSEDAPSFLKNYYSMPYKQYKAAPYSELADTINLDIANLDKEPKYIAYKYQVFQDSGPQTFTDDKGSYYINPYLSSGYCNYPPFAHSALEYYFPTNLPDQRYAFHIVHQLTSGPDPQYWSNDSLVFTQLFDNYYAYDNGTAEAGIGINGSAGSYVVKFQLNAADTLRGLSIYFNQVQGQTNQKNIDLVVMNDVKGKPGNVIATIDGIIPQYGSQNNEFLPYWFENPVSIQTPTFPDLTFYVGWQQSIIDNINIGFDRRYDSHSKRYINTTGTWETSNPLLSGSLMLRPIIGVRSLLGRGEISDNPEFVISPNPVTSNSFSVVVKHEGTQRPSDNYQYRLLTLTGQKVSSGSIGQKVSVEGLPDALYLLQIISPEGILAHTAKIIVAR